MKTWILVIAATLSFFGSQAQLAGTSWKGTIKGDNPRNVILNFKENTCSLYTISDSTLVEEMVYSIENKTFTVKKLEGQSDCDNVVPGNYGFSMIKDSMFVKKIKDDCEDRSSALDATKWVKWKNHPEVKVDAAILEKYAGTYALNNDRQVIITLENGQLFIEGPKIGLPKLPLITESKTRVFLKVAGVEMDFVSDAKGNVTKMISHEEKDYELKKIK
ncbi:MAG TPA: DUF3471 domain-containing protein [Puia sp.]|nr:DUF3471 domain-containing protein [Puia sp.]